MKTRTKCNLPLALLFGVGLSLCRSHAVTEAELVAILKSDADPVHKAEACKQLRRVGTTESVPALAPLLLDQRLSHAARHALEAIPGLEAGAALRAAVPRTTGLIKAGVVDSLGWRRDAAAVPLLEPLLADPDATIASAAARALGRIGGKQAVTALTAAAPNVVPAACPAVAEALLQCAEQLLTEAKSSEAGKIYRALLKSSQPEHIRVAAHAGLIHCAGKHALSRIRSALRSSDPAAQLAALQVAGKIQTPEMTRLAAELLPRSSPPLQVALLALLKTRGDPAALPAVEAVVRSPDAAVRIAALAALGELGDVRAVPVLVQAATSPDPATQKVARQALINLHRGDVTAALVSWLNTAPPQAQAELAVALSARGDKAAVPALAQLARSDRPDTRKAALQALGNLVDGSHLDTLVSLLAAARHSDARQEVIGVFESLAERTAEGEKLDADAIKRGLAGGDFEVRTALLQVCPLFVNDELRAALRAALSDPDERIRDAAARALCNARDAALLPELLRVAAQTPDATLRSGAIEGIVRLTTDDAAALSDPQRAEALAAAWRRAARPEDKRRVLSGLARVANPVTLELVREAATDPAVQAEARVALTRITSQLQVSSGPFFQDWLVCGPYRKPGLTGATAVFDVPFGPEIPGEPLQWRVAPRADQVNLAALFPGQENCVAYLKTALITPDDSDALLLVGSDDGVKVWLNGAVVHANNTDRPNVPDQDRVLIHLARGTNVFLFKVTQGGGGWSVQARIVGMDGRPIPGLQALAPTAASAESERGNRSMPQTHRSREP